MWGALPMATLAASAGAARTRSRTCDRTGAQLCVLELGPADERRAVAALLHCGGQPTQLLELRGLYELAWHAEQYAPEAGDRRRGPLRGARPAETRSVSTDTAASAPGFAGLLVDRMSLSFWAPLQHALQTSSVAIDRLHVCLHGTTQQLPLALRLEIDCPGEQVIPWPGLPYLRRAAMAAN
jgi:hypothetical protein